MRGNTGTVSIPRKGRLPAVRFDPGRLEVGVEPAPVWDGVCLSISSDPAFGTRLREAAAPTRIELVQNRFMDLRARVPVD